MRELEHGGSREHLIHGADAKPRIQPIGGIVFAVGQPVGAGEDDLVPFGDHDGSGEAVFGGPFLDFGLQRNDGFGFAQPSWRGRVRSRGNELEAELLELVRRGGIDLHCESGDVIGIPNCLNWCGGAGSTSIVNRAMLSESRSLTMPVSLSGADTSTFLKSKPPVMRRKSICWSMRACGSFSLRNFWSSSR